MKHWKLIVGILVAIVIADVILTFFLLHKSTPVITTPATSNPFSDVSAPNESLATFTTNCFTSYIQAYMANQQTNDPGQFDQDAQSCFTPAFIQQWPSIISNSEADPVLISQDYENSWASNVSSSVSSLNESSATVNVTIGTGSEMMQLVAQLQMTSGGWRISSVSRSSS